VILILTNRGKSANVRQGAPYARLRGVFALAACFCCATVSEARAHSSSNSGSSRPSSGTDQYEDFLSEGLIWERNLDRFDAQALTWQHDKMDAVELDALLFECYKRFYSAARITNTALRNLREKKFFPDLIPGLGVTLFHRVCAWKHLHPMSGGVGRVRRDSDRDYRLLRRRRYDLDLVPLPRSLELSKSDAELNRRVKIVL